MTDTPTTTVETEPTPLWTGCPAGCGQHGHECGVGQPIATSCHACGALTIAERESLVTCWPACPMRQVS